MRVMTLLFPEGFPREEALAISALLQTPEREPDRAVLDKCFCLIDRDPKLKQKVRAAQKAGEIVAIIQGVERL